MHENCKPYNRADLLWKLHQNFGTFYAQKNFLDIFVPLSTRGRGFAGIGAWLNVCLHDTKIVAEFSRNYWHELSQPIGGILLDIV